jgi:tetrahydromethanopterin S-methyltransferase subunit F
VHVGRMLPIQLQRTAVVMIAIIARREGSHRDRIFSDREGSESYNRSVKRIRIILTMIARQRKLVEGQTFTQRRMQDLIVFVVFVIVLIHSNWVRGGAFGGTVRISASLLLVVIFTFILERR